VRGAADQTMTNIHLYHQVNNSLLVMTPCALILSPSPWAMPVDLALGIFLPLHGHIGMNSVLTDYMPKFGLGDGFVKLTRYLMLGTTLMTTAGLTRLNLEGDGISGTIKKLWKPDKK
jgi:succinate dehydrogenase (ubiquinone) membrane anchor subunit